MHSTETFYVENIKCVGCINRIKESFLKLTGISEVQVFIDQGKVCVMGVGLNRYSLAEKLTSMGYPQKGNNSSFNKAKSMISCLLGRAS